MSSKFCKKCSSEKPLTDFYLLKSGKRKGTRYFRCKSCISDDRKALYASKPKMMADINRRARYKYKYGLEEHEIKKYGECPLCLKEKKLVVDHCHTEGYVRGFICYSCNTLLGHIENEEKMQRIKNYLNYENKEDL